MTLSPGKLPIGRQIFSDIIQKNMIYVDKTAILADLISGDPLVRFLSRPRRFGKSLTVSTLEAVFSGQKELFKGLAIEERLDEECFAPRPVIKLDLSLVHAGLGVEGLRKDLAELTDPLAVRLGVSQSVEDDPYSKKVSFNKTLVNLIEVCAKNSGRPVAVLIDEYDKPDLSFMRRSAEMEDAREVLRDYYTQLKAAEKDISLIFVTGISKFSRRGIFSVFNNVFDISIMPEFGAICGFTQQELESDFPGHIEETAQALRISPTELLDKMRDYYDGFCFDGVTRVYNPFSILQFFKVKKFDNFWFESGTSLYLAQYLRDKRLTVEQFRGLAVDREFARNPGEMDKATPESFLYQAGYLSLRPGNDPDSFTLDYPNREVLKSMSRLLLENIFGSLEKIRFLIRDLTLAFKSRDPAGVIQVFQEVLAPIPYDDYVAANRKTFESLNKVDYGEFLYRAVLLSFLDLIGLTP
ncbi:MAG: AAA family ATPase, partial [Deltaproteobacteria bacterium]|nr:AAA family ATPase [Deltaproteobacteria bacterium]